jgi:hypothetical protein
VFGRPSLGLTIKMHWDGVMGGEYHLLVDWL